MAGSPARSTASGARRRVLRVSYRQCADGARLIRLAQEGFLGGFARPCPPRDRIRQAAPATRRVRRHRPWRGRRVRPDLGRYSMFEFPELGSEILRRRADDGDGGCRYPAGRAAPGRPARGGRTWLTCRYCILCGRSPRHLCVANRLCRSVRSACDRAGDRQSNCPRSRSGSSSRQDFGTRAGAGCATGAATSATAKQSSSSATHRRSSTGRTWCSKVPHVDDPQVVDLAKRLDPDVIAGVRHVADQGTAPGTGAARNRQSAWRPFS